MNKQAAVKLLAGFLRDKNEGYLNKMDFDRKMAKAKEVIIELSNAETYSEVMTEANTYYHRAIRGLEVL